mgnify:FL=1
MIQDNDAVIVSSIRTALGAYNGTLSSMDATDLGAIVIREAVKKAGIQKSDVQEIIMGMVLPCGYGQNPARQAAIRAEMPMEPGGLTVNKVCGSGLMSVVLASELIKSGYAEVVVAGGMENMSKAPYYLPNARWGARMGDSPLMDHMVHDGLWDINNNYHMGTTNDIISREWEISREDQDKYALGSYDKALKSIREGVFKDEIVPVVMKSKKGDVVFDTDECPRATSLELLSKMKPAFTKDGFATAGNASVISDGAAAAVVMSYKKAKALGLKPLVKIVASGSAGVDLPHVLMAPIKSIPHVCRRAGIEIKDIGLQEINEAFSGSTLAVMKELKLDREIVNVNGGSVALGHPIGASGARVLATLIHEMKRRKTKLGAASLCLGGAEAVTMIVENIE